MSGQGRCPAQRRHPLLMTRSEGCMGSASAETACVRTRLSRALASCCDSSEQTAAGVAGDMHAHATAGGPEAGRQACINQCTCMICKSCQQQGRDDRRTSLAFPWSRTPLACGLPPASAGSATASACGVLSPATAPVLPKGGCCRSSCASWITMLSTERSPCGRPLGVCRPSAMISSALQRQHRPWPHQALKNRRITGINMKRQVATGRFLRQDCQWLQMKVPTLSCLSQESWLPESFSRDSCQAAALQRLHSAAGNASVDRQGALTWSPACGGWSAGCRAPWTAAAPWSARQAAAQSARRSPASARTPRGRQRCTLLQLCVGCQPAAGGAWSEACIKASRHLSERPSSCI